MTISPDDNFQGNPALARILEHHGITVVLDVGANVGQYATRLRQAAGPGRIVSFEPLPTARVALEQAAAADPLWEVAPPMALGASAGTVTLNVSPESDMSSTLPFLPEMADLLDSAAYTGTVRPRWPALTECSTSMPAAMTGPAEDRYAGHRIGGIGRRIRHSGSDTGHSA